ncbi:18896_t:CDS:2, partial [Acaulospora morrowiae]
MEYQPIDLPVIDLSPLEDNIENSSPEILEKIAREIKSACTKHGVFYITSSSFKLEEQKNILESSHKFFALPESVKNTIPIKSGGFTRGYVGIGSESGSHRLEVKEAFSYGYEWNASENPTNSLQGPNEWGNLGQILGEEWRESLKRFYNLLVHLATLVVKGLELALGIELKSHCSGGETISLMRLFRYFPYENKEQDANENEKIGSSPHTDWGFLTLVLQQEDTQGLQVFYNDQWWDIPSKPASIIVNCGDYLSLLSRGTYISPLHRVVNDGMHERYSCAFFYYPRYDSKIPMFNQDADNEILCSKELSLFKNQTNDFNDQKENMIDLTDICFGE